MTKPRDFWNVVIGSGAQDRHTIGQRTSGLRLECFPGADHVIGVIVTRLDVEGNARLRSPEGCEGFCNALMREYREDALDRNNSLQRSDKREEAREHPSLR